MESDMLLVAVSKGDKNLLQKLLTQNPLQRDLDEALLVASTHPNKEIIELLIDNGAQVRKSIVDLSKKVDNREITKFLEQYNPSKEYSTFEEQVQATINDLMTYPEADIKLMAKQMRIVNHQNASDLCREIATKLIYIHSGNVPKSDLAKCNRYSKKISDKEIADIRDQLHSEFSQFKDAVTDMTTEDLYKIFKRYDELCFNGDIMRYIYTSDYNLEFKLSGEHTFTTEGICGLKTCNYVITIPTEFFRNVGKITIVAGHPCKDQLDCLLRVVEHELTHLLIFMFCGDNFITDQHGELFMNMVADLFGHTDHRHYIF